MKATFAIGNVESARSDAIGLLAFENSKKLDGQGGELGAEAKKIVAAAMKRGEFAPKTTRVEETVPALAGQGLKIQEMIADPLPLWALDRRLINYDALHGANHSFPNDLRDVFHFFKGAGERYKGQVQCWEPRNESQMRLPGHEIAAYQKAAYLGLKAADPDLIVSLVPWDGARDIPDAQLENLTENDALPYMDTYNIHLYASLDQYDDFIGRFRAVAGGRPMWLTECGIQLPAADQKTGDLSWSNKKKQASFVGPSFAAGIHEGIARHFFFYLPHLNESGTQHGVLHKDMTPRPGYVALAAAGRLLAGAKPLGRVDAGEPGFHGYFFDARPDGRQRAVMVFWRDAERQDVFEWPPPPGLADHRLYDVLGRPAADRGPGRPVIIGPSPLYLVMPRNAVEDWPLVPPPQIPKQEIPPPCPVVMDLRLPRNVIDIQTSCYHIPTGKPVEATLKICNLGETPARGRLVAGVFGVRVEIEETDIALIPNEIKEIPVQFKLTAPITSGSMPVFFSGDFGDLGKSVCVVRFASRYDSSMVKQAWPVASAMTPENWRHNVGPNCSMAMKSEADGALRFEFNFPPHSYNWAGPILTLAEAERIPPDADGILFKLKYLHDRCRVWVQFDEGNGATYLSDVLYAPVGYNEESEVVVLFDKTKWGPWSKKDPNGRLDLDQVTSIKIGTDVRERTRIRFTARDVQWVRF